MTAAQRRATLAALAGVLILCAALAAHRALEGAFPPALGAIVALVPIAGLSVWAVRRASHRAWVVGGAAALAILLWLRWDILERHFSDLLFLEHAGGNLALAFVFARTLAPGREPLCTRFARMMHDSIPPEVVAYTRRITLAWAIFFLALASASIVLHLAGFEHAWSLLATVASPILVGLMFVGEYAVRLRALPNWRQVGVLGAVRVFSRHVAGARLESPR